MKRKQDWPEALHAFVESRISTPFEYGSNDCALFVADALLAMTGTDIASDFRGQYTDLKGSLAVIKSACDGTSAEDLFASVAGGNDVAELPSVLYAQRGDVVVFDGEYGPALGVVYLNGRDALFVTPDGLKRQPVKNCRRAWRIA